MSAAPGIGDEPAGRRSRPTGVSPGQRGTTHVELTDATDGHGVQELVQHGHALAGSGVADRHGVDVTIVDKMAGDVDGGLRRPVRVEQPYPMADVLDEPRGKCFSHQEQRQPRGNVRGVQRERGRGGEDRVSAALKDAYKLGSEGACPFRHHEQGGASHQGHSHLRYGAIETV